MQFLRFVIIFISFSDGFLKKLWFSDEKYGQLVRTTGILIIKYTNYPYHRRTGGSPAFVVGFITFE
jgi:hypothetical protein